eukprot:scaffold169818_cov31-Tisochrysis_lutea.AAC.3
MAELARSPPQPPEGRVLGTRVDHQVVGAQEVEQAVVAAAKVRLAAVRQRQVRVALSVGGSLEPRGYTFTEMRGAPLKWGGVGVKKMGLRLHLLF